MALTSERDWMQQLKRTLTQPQVLEHDAFWDPESGLVISTDTLVEDIHFKREWTSMYALGYKTAMVNLSDLAATLATPTWLSLNLSLPDSSCANALSDFYKGVQDALTPSGAIIIGGDTTASPHWVITATAIGHIQPLNAVGRRSHAQPDYGVYYKGPAPGLSALGLLACQHQRPESDCPEARKTHHQPEAQTEAAKLLQALATQNGLPVVTCIDTSDGLANAVLLIAEASEVTINIKTEQLPEHPELLNYGETNGREALQTLQYYGGEDYGLVCCLPTRFEADLNALDWQRIGSVHTPQATHNPHATASDAQAGTVLLTFEQGFQHFRAIRQAAEIPSESRP